jgi:hypothetical protein
MTHKLCTFCNSPAGAACLLRATNVSLLSTVVLAPASWLENGLYRYFSWLSALFKTPPFSCWRSSCVDSSRGIVWIAYRNIKTSWVRINKSKITVLIIHIQITVSYRFITPLYSTYICGYYKTINSDKIKIRHPSLSTVNWFQKNGALRETALSELHRKVSVQKLKSAT